MFRNKRTRWLMRPTASLVVLCYLWLATVGSCLHTDFRVSTTNETHSSSVRVPHGKTAAASGTAFAVNSYAAADHCVTCDWQAANLSPALALFAYSVTMPRQPDVTSASPRSPSQTAFETASRAPPAV